jgi:hypothetical protein
MKPKFAVLLSAIPLILIVSGIASLQAAKKFPYSESPSSLRQYIHGIQMNESELSVKEAEMLQALTASVKELNRFHEIFSASKDIFEGGAKFLIGLGILQLMAIGLIYTKSRPEPVGAGQPM